MQLVGKNVLPPTFVAPVRDGEEGPSQFALRYCPSMDLVAVFQQHVHLEAPADGPVDHDEHNPYADDDDLVVHVYRLNGQQVFAVNIDSDSNSIGIIDVAWRHDGILLAIVTSDNKLRLANSFSGRIVQTCSTVSESQSVPTGTLPESAEPSSGCERTQHPQSRSLPQRECIPTSVYYSTHFLEPDSVQADLDRASGKQRLILEDLLSVNADLDSLLNVAADLPKALANIDVESALPKLSTLPPFGVGDDDIFSTRTSLDTIFHSSKHSQLTSTLNAVLVAHSDTIIHIRIFDSFEVGDIDLNYTHAKPADCQYRQVRQCVSHPFSSKIWIVVDSDQWSSSDCQAQDGSFAESRLHLLSLDLQFMHHSISLPILATKATQLRNLIRYLSQIQTQLAREVKTAFDLPARFIRTLEDELKEAGSHGSSFEASAYHALLTGNQHGKFQEWLSEILGDRGVKRWEKAVAECLDLTRRLISENWLPATERASVVVSRLLGLAGAEPSLHLNEGTLCVLRDTFDVMTIIGDEILRDIGTEIGGFNAFIRWLSWEVEVSSLEDTSEKLKDMREARDHNDVNKIIDYIKKRLRNTSIQRYINNSTVHPLNKHDGSMVNILERYGASSKEAPRRPPSMKSLISQVSEQCDKLFQQVSSVLRNDTVVQHVCTIRENIDSDMLDTRIFYERGQPEQYKIRVVGRSTRQGEHVSLLNIEIGHCINSVTRSEVAQLESGADVRVHDVKFVDDDNLLVLATTDGISKMWNYEAEILGSKGVKHLFDSSDEMVQAGLRPWKIEVNGRKKRRAVAVLDEEGRGYGIYDIDSIDNYPHQDNDGNEV